ncbi:MAG: MacB family efflux pump subunit, partial [Campylobacter sp.]
MIKLVNLNKIFKIGENEFNALNDINLSIKKGEFIAIVGQSGSGKSTLMNILGCLDSPSSGSYILDEKDITNYNAEELAALRRDKFGFIFQRYNLLPMLNSLQNVCMPSIYAGVSQALREQKGRKILQDLGLGDKLENLPNKLSGGQQQRVSIARALINGGDIIFADEPTGALDSKSGIMVMEILTNLHKKGHTVIIVTHDQNIANYANRIIEIKDGKIINDIKKRDEIFAFEEKKSECKNLFAFYKDQLTESFKMSVNAIISHKLRSLLTMLGIIIGITSVISVVALGKGSQEQILSDIRGIGTNTIEIFAGRGFGDARSGRVQTLSLSDVAVLEKQDYLDSVTPNTSVSGGVLTYLNKSPLANLQGGGEKSLDVMGYTLESGRNYTKREVEESASVLVIDQNTKKQLFNNIDPIGKIVFYNKRPFTIIGVLAKKETGFSNSALNVYAPYTAVFNKISGDRKVRSIIAKVSDDVNAQIAEKSITEILELKHGRKDFFIRNSDTIKKTIEDATKTMTILISCIAFISLLVGGIGVMNIMLVSVTERTKEIGIRMAIGARQSNILQQFLIEAVMLCLAGGAIGVLLAFLLGYLVVNCMQIPMIFSTASVVVALLTSSIIGIIFGFMPAKTASN